MHVERYFLRLRNASLPAFRSLVLGVHLAGAQATGGQRGGTHAQYVPSLCVLIPPGNSTEWRLAGTIDLAVFYLADVDSGAPRGAFAALRTLTAPIHFADDLVAALARQMVDELQRGTEADCAFVEQLAGVLLAQLVRVSRGVVGRRVSPAALQLHRLGKVIDWIRANPAADLSTAALARRAGVSDAHFHRLFAASMGATPQHFVRQSRLEQAAEMLTRTAMPIPAIAQRSGFQSQSHLTTCFAKVYAVTPARYRRAAQVAL